MTERNNILSKMNSERGKKVLVLHDVLKLLIRTKFKMVFNFVSPKLIFDLVC